MKRTLRTLGKLATAEHPVEEAKSIASEPMGSENFARKAWLAFGGLLALGAVVMFVREIPSMRREWRLMRM